MNFYGWRGWKFVGGLHRIMQWITDNMLKKIEHATDFIGPPKNQIELVNMISRLGGLVRFQKLETGPSGPVNGFWVGTGPPKTDQP